MALKVWLPLSGDVTTNYGLTDAELSTGAETPVFGNGILGGTSLALGTAGVSTYVSALVEEALPVFSITLWVKDTSSPTGAYLFSVEKDNAKVFACIKTAEGYQIPELAAGTLFTLSAGWNHVAITADGTTVKAYVNGVQSEAGDVNQIGNFNITDNYGVVVAGYRPNAESAYLKNFNGNISNFKVYDTALSLFEVVNEANGLVVNYSFNGISLGTGITLPAGTTAADFGFGDKEHDLSGNEFDAPYGEVLPVKSNDTAVYSASMDFTEASAIVSPVIKTQEFVGRYTLSVWAKGTGTIATVGSGTPITASDASEWHNIVVTNSGKKYVDGVEDGTLSGVIVSGDNTISIGGSFTGLLSDFRIYATAMSDEQIANLYSRKAAIDNSGKLIAAEFVVDDEAVEKPAFNSKGVVSAANIGNWTGESESPSFIESFSITAATGAVNVTDVIEF